MRASPREELEAREKLSNCQSLLSDQAGSICDTQVMETTSSQTVIFHSAPVFPSTTFTVLARIIASAGSISYPETMDTTPPSQAVIFLSAPFFLSNPFTALRGIGASACSTSDTKDMDTTTPYQGVIFQSAPSPSITTTHFTPLLHVLETHHPVVAMSLPMPRLRYLQSHSTDRATLQSYDRMLSKLYAWNFIYYY